MLKDIIITLLAGLVVFGTPALLMTTVSLYVFKKMENN